MTPLRTSRVALYWTPDRGDPLWIAGNAWLGRDPERGAPVPQPKLAGMAEITSEPRLYGFHATLRPPMRLSTGWNDFMGAAERVAAACPDFTMPPLAVTDLDGFLALCAAVPCPELSALADRCVQATDPHRLRPDLAELAKRRRGGLSPGEDAMLLRWGYPHVMEHWRFHMTLTRRLSAAELAAVRPEAERHFAPALSRQRRAGHLTVFTQAASSDAASPFLIAERLPLRPTA